MQPALRTGALLDRVRADLDRPDASPQQLRTALAEVVPAAQELLVQVAELQGKLAQARTCPVTACPRGPPGPRRPRTFWRRAPGSSSWRTSTRSSRSTTASAMRRATPSSPPSAAGSRSGPPTRGRGRTSRRRRVRRRPPRRPRPGRPRHAAAHPAHRPHHLPRRDPERRSLHRRCPHRRPRRGHRVRRSQAGRRRDVPGQGPRPPRPPARGDRAAAHPALLARVLPFRKAA